MSEANKTLVRGFYDAINAGNTASLEQIVADSFVEHEELPGFAPTKEGCIQFFGAVREAFPDFQMRVEDMIAEGDKVSIRVTMSGTQKGEFLGIPATGKQVNVPASDYLRLENGKVVEHWGVTDMGALMQQLGVAG